MRRVRVLAQPNPDFPGSLLLTFFEPCPFCGDFHRHGAYSTTRPDLGSYGPRLSHCSAHTHATTGAGNRARLTRANQCRTGHDYELVPA